MEYVIPSVSAVLSLTALGAVFGLILSIVKSRLRVEHDPRFEKIVESLPGANCGACGQPGCSGYAAKIVRGEVEINLCAAGGAVAVDEIANIMGVISVGMKPALARVRCQGTRDVTRERFVYDGPRSCAAAQQVMEGFKACRFGCLGLGDCARVCPFDALHMNRKTGLPEVDSVKCTGCGRCVNECPRAIIALVDRNFDVHMRCVSRDRAPAMKRACDVGCTACMRCVKACREVFKDSPDIDTAIEVVDFLAVFDYDRCINCGRCAEVCPQKVINPMKVSVEA